MGTFIINTCTGTEMKRALLPKGTIGGQCLDGTPAGFYYSPPPSGSSNLWVIYIKGGGYCASNASCTSRANTSHGSSNYWNDTVDSDDLNQGGVLSSDPNINPDFYNGHHVFCPYCSGDVWGGQRTKPSTNPDTWGFYFSGHLIFSHIVQYLANNLNMFETAQYVLLTGSSAGGIGTFDNIDWLNDQLKEKGKFKNNVTAKGAPVAGWFFAGNTTDQLNNPMMPPNDYPHWTQHQNGGLGHDNSTVILYDAYLNPECVADLGPDLAWHCGSIHNVYRYISSPLFVMQNRYDCDELVEEFLMPNPKKTVNNETIGYVEYVAVDNDRSIITQMVDESNKKNGLFYASCYDHTSGLGIGVDLKAESLKSFSTTINGYNSSQLVGDWFWERNLLPHIVMDTCNDAQNTLPCNPSCKAYPPRPNQTASCF